MLTLSFRSFVKIHTLSTSEGSPVNVVNLIISYALRIGAVEHSTWQECLSAARSRGDGTVAWKHPEWRLFTNPEISYSPRLLREWFQAAIRSTGLDGLEEITAYSRKSCPTWHSVSLRARRAESFRRSISTSPQLLMARDPFITSLSSINFFR